MKITVEQALLHADSHAHKGNVAKAEKLYMLILQAAPNNERARQGLASVSAQNSEAVQPTPQSPPQDAIDELVDLYNQKQYERVVERAKDLTEKYPKAFIVWNFLGAALYGLKHTENAFKAFEKVVAINSNFPDAFNNIAIIYNDNFDYTSAIKASTKAIALNSNYANAYNSLGNALMGLGHWDQAFRAYSMAVTKKSDYTSAYNNMGIILKEQGKLDEAIHYFRKALSCNPNKPGTYNNLGNTLRLKGALETAIDSYIKALLLKPDYVIVETQLLHQKQHICDFEISSHLTEASSRLGITTDAVPPFSTLSWVDNPNEQQLRSEKWASERYRQEPLLLPARPTIRPERIKVGYFSADFHDHATMYLMAGLLREHNKEEFELFAYSYGCSKSGNWRKKAEDDIDFFYDVTDCSDRAIVDLARSHGLDIAIDLKGYTQHSRSGIFQFRVAPIQMNFLGYPGTMGADFIDYIIADPIVIPDDQREFYSEQVIYLPHSYQPNDDTREIADTQTTRSDFGLPEDAFVLCCFNNNYKISPREFGIWMRLLDQIDGSVLWLLKSNKWAEQNLRKETELRGVAPERLVFAERSPHTDHLARHRHADLFVDTFNCNAHTTASDALWGGLPVVTKQGKQFAARVAASLLKAVGLPELITETEEDYERLIIELARQPKRLSAIKAKLAKNRSSEPLFDTKRYTRNFERGLKAAYDLYFEGKQPADIWVSEDEV